ncbi:GyrI-like domain-containing protein [Paenibacillus cymbidii]|uniref:GyrI-like domain-containing protein n=1 Tax=Paenibacillus cymbidii TaxID=1639034 RepID=UPI001081114B|nr:GyrI-like domain-containing protein [Paenibacillus cymbidii]
MNFRFVSRESFKFIGIKETSSIHKNGVFVPDIDQTRYMDMQTFFVQVSKEKVDEILLVAIYHTDDQVDCYIGFETMAECPYSLIELIIAKQMWVVFELSSISPRSLYNTWNYLFSEWFSANGYELVENAQFFRVIQVNALYELWVPIARSKTSSVL